MKATITTTAATEDAQVEQSAMIELYGTWDGASIDLQILTDHGEWQTVQTFTEDTLDQKIEPGAPSSFRFKASAVGTTSVKVSIR